MKEYVGIYTKTEKAQEQDGFGNKIKYHFHITTDCTDFIIESLYIHIKRLFNETIAIQRFKEDTFMYIQTTQLCYLCMLPGNK